MSLAKALQAISDVWSETESADRSVSYLTVVTVALDHDYSDNQGQKRSLEATMLRR